MIKLYWLTIALSSILLSACNKEERIENTDKVENKAQKASAKEVVNVGNLDGSEQVFNPENLVKIHVGQKDFPYFLLPQDYKVMNFKVLDYQKYYFAIDNKPVQLEGELYRTQIGVEPGKQFSESYLEKKFNQSMKAMGAQKLNESEIPYHLYENLKDHEGHSSVNIGKTTHTYGFKNNEGHPIIVQLSLNSPTVVVMEISPDETEMRKVKLE